MKKKMVRRIIAILCIVSMFLEPTIIARAASFPNRTVESPNYTVGVSSVDDLNVRLRTLISKYDGTYWTSRGSACSSHSGTCYSKYYYGWQCKGFAAYIFNDLFCGGNIGAYDETNFYYINNPQNATLVGQAGNISSNDTATVKSILSKAQPGDFIQVRRRGKNYGHSMIVVSVDANGLQIFDCNSDGKCGVDYYYQNWTTFASLNSGLSLYHSKKYPENVCQCSESYAGSYVCTTSNMDLNIRSGHGSSYSVIGAIPSGSMVYVSKASGTGVNDWAHVEYNGISGYASMQYLSGSHNPEGHSDGVSGGIHSVSVSGWVFDRDNLSATLRVDVYVGGTFAGSLTANKERADVDKVHQCGKYHGYAGIIEVESSKSGSQLVEVYAINVGGGSNALIKSKTVEIGSDTESPKISNITVTDVTTEGYVVSCTVTDNVMVDRVQFPTWTSKNGQDDLCSNWLTNGGVTGSKEGDTYTYKISRKEHNNESGIYVTHIYAYDKYGNCTGYSGEELVVDVPSALTGISINTKPNKTVYYVGDSFSLNGLTIKAVYENGVEEIIKSGFKCDATTFTEAGWQIITISYGGKTASFTVKVLEKEIELESLVIAKKPYKTSYVEGEDIDFTGLEVKVFYTNGTSKLVENYTISYNKELQVGTNRIDIIYRENQKAVSAALEITVIGLCDISGHYWEYSRNEDIGTHTKSCKVCNKKIIENCTINTKTIEATDTENGCIEGFCNICGYSQIIEILPSKFIIDENGVLTGYAGNDTEVIIPDSVKGIGYYAFRDCTSIKSIVIPDSVTSIGIASFSGCTNLKEITIPDSVTSIGVGAFCSCKKLEGIVIPSSVTSIGNDAFRDCTNLKEVVIPDGITSIEDRLFCECEKLEAVIIPDSVKSIGEYAFWQCKTIERIEIPDSVTSIGRYAFSGCYELSELILSQKLDTIGALAFQFCRSLEEIMVPNTVTTIGEDAFLGCSKITIYCFKDTYANKYAVENNLNYISSDSFSQADVKLSVNSYVYDGTAKQPSVTVKLANKMLTLGTDYTVNYANNTEVGTATVTVTGKGNYTGTVSKTFTIETVSLEDADITLSVSSYVYDGTSKEPAVTVKLGDKTLVLGTDYTINYADNVEVGTATVTVSGKGNYAGTVSKTYTITAAVFEITNVTLDKTSYDYDGKIKKPSVIVMSGNKKLAEDIDYTVSYKNNKNIGTATVTITGKGSYAGTIVKTFTIKLDKGVTFSLGKYKYRVTASSSVAFNGIVSNKTTKVTIPKTVKYGGKTFKVTSVANKALKGKTKVTEINIGANVTTIGSSAFAGCTKLSKVIIGSKVKTIGVSAFEGCKKLSKVVMGSAVATIEDKAFKNCVALKSITIPSKVTKMDKQAFYGCKNLKTISIKSTKLKTVGKDAFKKINAKAIIEVPKSKFTSYKKLLKGKGQGSKVKIVKL